MKRSQLPAMLESENASGAHSESQSSERSAASARSGVEGDDLSSGNYEVLSPTGLPSVALHQQAEPRHRWRNTRRQRGHSEPRR